MDPILDLVSVCRAADTEKVTERKVSNRNICGLMV